MHRKEGKKLRWKSGAVVRCNGTAQLAIEAKRFRESAFCRLREYSGNILSIGVKSRWCPSFLFPLYLYYYNGALKRSYVSLAWGQFLWKIIWIWPILCGDGPPTAPFNSVLAWHSSKGTESLDQLSTHFERWKINRAFIKRLGWWFELPSLYIGRWEGGEGDLSTPLNPFPSAPARTCARLIVSIGPQLRRAQ